MYFSNKNGVYIFDTQLSGANVASFNAHFIQSAYSKSKLPSNYAMDKSHVYYNVSIIPQADPETFKIIESSYATDKNSVYLNGERFDSSDPSTFEIIDLKQWLAKDKNHVYFVETVIKDADPFTFEVIDNSLFFKDKNHVFWASSILPEANPSKSKLLPRDTLKIGVYVITLFI